jgi:hypothetical protein
MATSNKPTPDKRPKNTPIDVVIDQIARNPNLTTMELGKLNGVDHSAVVRLLQRHGITRERVEDYKTGRADLLAGLQETVLASITGDDIKKASLRDKVIAMATLYDKERLERGQSTQNASVFFRIIEQACDSEPVVIADNTTDSERDSGK